MDESRPMITVVDLRNIPKGARQNKVFTLSRAARMFIINNPERLEATVLNRRGVEMSLVAGETLRSMYADYRLATEHEVATLPVDYTEVDYSSFNGVESLPE